MTKQTLSTGSTPSIKIENVGGDLSLGGWDRSEIEASGDEIRQRGQNGDQVVFSCGGDLSLSTPRGANLTIGYVGGDLKVEGLNGSVEIAFVGGDAFLQNLSGKVSLAGAIGGEVQMENVGKISMEPRKGGLNADLSEQIRSRVEEATRRAERKMRDTEQKIRRAEVKIQNAKIRHGEHRAHAHINVDAGRWKWNMAPGSFPPGGPGGDPVSDEERMAILKMLEEKKITSEEAEKLLAALEGGS